MTDEMQNQAHGADEDHGEDHRKGLVTIFMNRDPFKIQRGPQKVARIKKVCRVPATWVIEFIEPSGQLKLLPDDSTWDIENDQHFVSHVAGGGSS